MDTISRHISNFRFDSISMFLELFIDKIYYLFEYHLIKSTAFSTDRPNRFYWATIAHFHLEDSYCLQIVYNNCEKANIVIRQYRVPTQCISNDFNAYVSVTSQAILELNKQTIITFENYASWSCENCFNQFLNISSFC